ncbi:MAG: SUMF1/EgtB/PvdO family nonheme iron enzyme, partial [Cyanobacteria bacterium J06641_5]
SGRVVRGGSWYSNPRICRSACRDDFNPGFRFNLIGFRVVCEARGL